MNLEDRVRVIKEKLGDNLCLLALVGSRAYGTSIESSDYDIRGFSIEPIESKLGLTSFKQYNNEVFDTTIYGLNKFIDLSLKCNPSVLDLYGLKKENILYINDYGLEILNSIDQILSKKIYYTFYGSAQSAYKRTNKLLNNLNKSKTNNASEIEKCCTKINKGLLNIIRYLDFGSEILETGKVSTFRPNNEFLLEIRDGKYLKNNNGLYEFSQEFELKKKELLLRIEDAYNISELPKYPNKDYIENKIINIYKDFYK